jgi:hypothetical protein
LLLGWEPERFLDWPPPDGDEDLRRLAKLAILNESHRLHKIQRENQAVNIAQAFGGALFGERAT